MAFNHKTFVATCLKTKKWQVTKQNKLCEKICGDQIGVECQKNCASLFEDGSMTQNNLVGIQVYKNKLIQGQLFDVAIICDGEGIISILCPLESDWSDEVAFYRERGLTPREIEVIELRRLGLKNKEIQEKLFISKSTLKTHINNIYRKLDSSAA